MPIHDWTRVSAGEYHDFHQDFTIELKRTLNRGLLPPGYLAMAEQKIGGPEPDVTVLHRHTPGPGGGGLSVADRPPAAAFAVRSDSDRAAYARRANRITVRKGLKRVVAVIELVSPGNKDSATATRAFSRKVAQFLRRGVHALILDPFPPTARDPGGISQLVWRRVSPVPMPARPADKPLTVASFDVAGDITAYVEPIAVGDKLPDVPLFLEPGWYVNVPLEAIYQASWREVTDDIRDVLEPTA